MKKKWNSSEVTLWQSLSICQESLAGTKGPGGFDNLSKRILAEYYAPFFFFFSNK